MTVLALAAAVAAGYAISEIEDTKDQNREGNQAVNSLRADLEVFREQVTQRLDSVENQVENAAGSEDLSKAQDDIAALDKKVKDLEDQSGSSNLSNRIDDLEQRVDDLEQKD